MVGMADGDGERIRLVRALALRACGNRKPIMAPIWRFSAWPAPTTDFLIRFGGYSATTSPPIAGASSAMPRAWPSFKVARAFSLTKVSSTAASCGLKLAMTLAMPSNSSRRR